MGLGKGKWQAFIDMEGWRDKEGRRERERGKEGERERERGEGCTGRHDGWQLNAIT